MKSLFDMSGKDILESGRFETFMGIVIALNAALIGFEVDWQARRVTQDMPQMFGSTALYRFMDLTFFVIFLAELMLKLYVHRVQFLTRREVSVLWNWFDFLIVLMQVLEEAFTLLTGFFRSDVDLSSVRLLRVVRVLKVLRIIRFIDMFAELRRIVTSIMGSLKSLGWTMALLFLLMYIVGIFFVQQITTHMADLTEEALNERELRMRNYFGSLPDAWMSLWKAISGGIDWDVLAEPLEKELGLLLGWAFAAYIAFSLLAVMNVVTGVFVQTALQSAEKGEDSLIEERIIALFSSTDKLSLVHRGGRALITLKEIQARLEDPQFERDWKAINVSRSEAEYIFELLDVTGCGEIGVEDFVAACIRLHGGAKSIDVLTVMQESRHSSRKLEEVSASTLELADSVRLVHEGQQQLAGALEEQRRGPLPAGWAGEAEACRSLDRLEQQLRSVEKAVQSVLQRSSDVRFLETLVETFVAGGCPQAGTGGSEAPGRAAQPDLGGCSEEVRGA